MPSYKELWPDRWLRPDVIGPNRVRVTVERITLESLFNPTTKKNENRLIAKFRGKELRLILNKTACNALEAIFNTDDYGSWHGKEIVLSTARASNGKMTIIVSPSSSQGSAPAPQPAPAPAPAATPHKEPEIEAYDGNPWEDGDEASPDVDFYPAKAPDLVHGQGVEHGNSGAHLKTPENIGVHGQEDRLARPVNNTTAPCPACHAPVGRPHATSCTLARSGEAARPADPVARSGNQVARPAPLQQEEFDFDAEVYRQMAALYDSDMPFTEELTDYVRKARNADKDSAMKMSATYLQTIISTLKVELSINDDEVAMVLAALVGYRVDQGARPGQLLHGYILKPLRDNDVLAKTCLNELSDICLMVFGDLAEGEPSGN